MWKSKKLQYGKNKHYSLINKLKRDGKFTDELSFMINSLSMEEVIGLKLELASRAVGGKPYGFKLWHSMEDIAKDAVLKYAYSACRTKLEVARFLGLNKSHLKKIIEKYEPQSYFEEEAWQKSNIVYN